MRREMRKARTVLYVALVLLSVIAAGCARRQAPATQPAPPPSAAGPGTETETAPPSGALRVEEPLPAAPETIREDAISTRALEDLNRDSPFKPVFYALDSAELDEVGRMVVTANAQLMKQYPTWEITVEGHCDERGTAEYNLALGERRAVAVRDYLVSLGIPTARIRTVSYGKEFPFDQGHDEAAWARNRRAHFVITSK